MALEEVEARDPASGKSIRISTTARIIYRKMYPEYKSVRNARLNLLIAKDFIENASNVLHYFRLGKKESPRHEYQPPGAEAGKVYSNTGEIRGTSSFFFISAINSDSVDILTVQSSWLKPKYKGSRENPIALGDT